MAIRAATIVHDENMKSIIILKRLQHFDLTSRRKKVQKNGTHGGARTRSLQIPK